MHIYGSQYRSDLPATNYNAVGSGTTSMQGNSLQETNEDHQSSKAAGAPSGMADLLSMSPRKFGYNYTSRESNERGMSQNE